MSKYAAIILAAGKGTRMNQGQASPIPKVMFKIAGRPMIEYAVAMIKKAGIEKIVLVVGYKKEIIKNYFEDKVEYAEQKEQLGTGHAVQTARKNLEGQAESIIVFYGDMPFYRPQSIKRLIDLYERKQPAMAMLTVNFKDPVYWAFGRIIRNKDGDIIDIIEQKDCHPDQLKIAECNPGFYIFRAEWLWQNISKLTTDNIQNEYYLTDMVKIARDQKQKIIGLPVADEVEVLGINTPEQLKQAEATIRKNDL